MAVHTDIEESSECRKLQLLRRQTRAELVDVAADCSGLDVGEFDVSSSGPFQKLTNGSKVGNSGVLVSDGAGKELVPREPCRRTSDRNRLRDIRYRKVTIGSNRYKVGRVGCHAPTVADSKSDRKKF